MVSGYSSTVLTRAMTHSANLISMRVIDLIQPLLLDSKLFEDPQNPRLPSVKGDGPGKRASRKNGTGLKIGQGGTLDPLADGVLGMSCAASRR